MIDPQYRRSPRYSPRLQRESRLFWRDPFLLNESMIYESAWLASHSYRGRHFLYFPAIDNSAASGRSSLGDLAHSERNTLTSHVAHPAAAAALNVRRGRKSPLGAVAVVHRLKREQPNGRLWLLFPVPAMSDARPLSLHLRTFWPRCPNSN